MERWASEAAFDVNFICICVNGDSTSLPVAKEFATKYKMQNVVNGYIPKKSDLPSFGQLRCQGLVLMDSQGYFITKRSAPFTQEGEKAWLKVEKMLFELGVYKGNKTAADFEEPPMRFSVGDRIEARVSRSQWLPGKVIAVRVHAMGREMPYKILLESGQMTFAPIDSDQVIRRLAGAEDLEIPSVQHEEMDHEHEDCMQALKKLQKTRSEASLREVYDHLKEHFEHEERLFAESGFGNHGTALSGTKSHCNEHARILSEISSNFGGEITQKFIGDLMLHVVNHTRDYDTKYAGKLN